MRLCCVSSLVLVIGGVVEVELLSADHGHDGVEDSELTGGECTDHDTTGTEAGKAEFLEALSLGNVDETRDGSTITTCSLLVDLGEESVGRVRDDGSGDTGDDTGRE